MGSQDGCCTKSGNAGTDYDDFLRGRDSIWWWKCVPDLLTHNCLCTGFRCYRFFRVSTILQLFEAGVCREQPASELKNGRRTTGLLRFVGRKMSDMEMLSHPELTSRHSLSEGSVGAGG